MQPVPSQAFLTPTPTPTPTDPHPYLEKLLLLRCAGLQPWTKAEGHADLPTSLEQPSDWPPPLLCRVHQGSYGDQGAG
ncbi:hypothetical protein COCON_G00106940 [Conger conger]|uniref:Uncharacterized protein n=1 Tax=Conger conger TaxID=82655 RepID=A0A9Q1DIU0_CONCO|nr:hypothetical protein COCON_G00106940 [Conger conger]